MAHIPSSKKSRAVNGTDTNRRTFLQTALVVTAGSFVTTLPLPGLANSVLTGSDPLKGFIKVTQTITERKHLDPKLAAHFFQAFAQTDKQFSNNISQLVKLIAEGETAVSFKEKATQQGLEPFLTRIVNAWYTGTVGDTYEGKLVAYKNALMYSTVSDGLIVPTYCGNGPIWWTEQVPEADNPEFIEAL